MQCDMKIGTCGQCVRASVICSGYRDTQQLRVQDESHSVAKKASKHAALCQSQPLASLPVSIESQARDMFFTYYATGTSKFWYFLTQYYYRINPPDHLKVALGAISCAYLWHVVDSEAALAMGRQKYVSALRLLNTALENSVEATKETTLLSSLVLDLFEKITGDRLLDNKTWTCHVEGAVALIKLRGLEHFQLPSEFPVLLRVINHLITGCVASASLVPNEVMALQDHVKNVLGMNDYTLQMSDLAARYAKFRNHERRGLLSRDTYIEEAMEIEAQLRVLEINMPHSWQYSTTILEHQSDRTSGPYFDVYPHRSICYARNLIRVARILLKEAALEHYLKVSTVGQAQLLITTAHDGIKTLHREICASVAQYTDCGVLACQKLPEPENCELINQIHRQPSQDHMHTLHHQADCYSLIFPLYIVGRSETDPDAGRWAMEQLHFIGNHFHIRNAERTARILEQGTEIYPWDVYAMLGSYAYNA